MPACRPAAWLGAGAIALVLGACGAGRSGSSDPSGRFFSVHNALRSNGMTQIGAVSRGQLGPSQTASFPLELTGQCITVVALAAGDVADIDVSLASPEGKTVVSDETHGPDATVRYCPDKPGKYKLNVKMAEGSGTYLVSTWAGGPPAGGETATSAAAANTGAGTCESPIAIVPGQTYVGDTEDGRSMEEGTCGNTSSRELVYRLDVSTRERVVIDVNAQFDSVLYVRRDDCEDRDAEIACNDDSGGPKRSRIDEEFEPGTYYIFVDGYQREEGGFRMSVHAQSAPGAFDPCLNAPVLVAGLTSAGQFATEFDHAHASCGRDARGSDVAYRFDLAARSRVRIREEGRGVSPVLHLRTSCSDESSEVGCRTAGPAGTATYTGVLDAGSYFVFADSSGDQGGYTLRADLASETGGTARSDTCGDAESIGAATGIIEADTFGARDDVSLSCNLANPPLSADAPDVIYRVDVGRRSHFVARVAYDEGRHLLGLQRSCGVRNTELACSTNIDQVLSPGTYFLVAEASNARAGDANSAMIGALRISYRLQDLTGLDKVCAAATPVATGRAINGTTSGLGNHFTASCAMSDEPQDSADRVYRLHVDKRATVRAMLTTTSYVGVLMLRRACEDPSTETGCAVGYSPGSRVQLNRQLEPGNYFLVVDGRGLHSDGEYTLQVDLIPDQQPKPKPTPQTKTAPPKKPPVTPTPTVRVPSKAPAKAPAPPPVAPKPARPQVPLRK